MSILVSVTPGEATVISVNQPWPADGDHQFFLQNTRTGRFLGETGWRPVQVTLPAVVLGTSTGLELHLDDRITQHIAPDTSLLLADVFRGLRATFHWPAAAIDPAPEAVTESAPKDPPEPEALPSPEPAIPPPEPDPVPDTPLQAPSALKQAIPEPAKPLPEPVDAKPETSVGRSADRRSIAGWIAVAFLLGAVAAVLTIRTAAPPLSTDVKELQDQLYAVSRNLNDARDLIGERNDRIAELERITINAAEQATRKADRRLQEQVTNKQELIDGLRRALAARDQRIADLERRLNQVPGDTTASSDTVEADDSNVPVPQLDVLLGGRPRGLWGAVVHGSGGEFHVASHEESRELAQNMAMRKCENTGLAQTCTLITTFENSCLSVAKDPASPRRDAGYAMQRTTPQLAGAAALEQCGRDWSQCALKLSVCSQ